MATPFTHAELAAAKKVIRAFHKNKNVPSEYLGGIEYMDKVVSLAHENRYNIYFLDDGRAVTREEYVKELQHG